MIEEDLNEYSLGIVDRGCDRWVVIRFRHLDGGQLGLGLEVSGFGSAFLAAIVIANVAGLVTWLLSMAGVQDGNGWIGGLVHLMISVLILMVCSRFLPVLKVDGFVGALTASFAIGAVYWLGGLLLGRLLM